MAAFAGDTMAASAVDTTGALALGSVIPPVIELVIQAVAPNLNVALLRDIFRQLASAPIAPPDSAGLDHKDPEEFIRRCKDLFRRHEAEDDQRVRIFEKAMK